MTSFTNIITNFENHKNSKFDKKKAWMFVALVIID